MKADFRNVVIGILIIVIIILFIPIVKKQTAVKEQPTAPAVPSEPTQPAESARCAFDSECISAEKGDKCDQGKCIYRKPIGTECASNSDCRPSTCCHPSKCAPLGQEPNCNDVFCTQECQPATMDCGKGSCQCLNNKCTAVIYG